jgi:DHA1 family multidrug resistance protein-like MFS transporter
MKFRYSIHKAIVLKDELQGVYVNLMIQSFAISLIAIFVPIYLLKLGYSLNQVILFEAVKFAGLSFFSPITALLAKRIGFKHLIFFRVPMYIFYLTCLIMLEKFSLPIYLIGLIGGVSGSLYWVSLKSIFAKHSHKEKRGYEASKASALPKLATIFGPAIGGMIAVALGFKVLVTIVCLLLFISVLPLISTGELYPRTHSFRSVFRKWLTLSCGLCLSISC